MPEPRAGACWVNSIGLFDPEVPVAWEGTAQSGYGGESGLDALHKFAVTDAVNSERQLPHRPRER